MRGKFTWILLGLSLLFHGCSTVEDAAETLKDWLGAEEKGKLETRRLSAFEFEDRLRGAWAGKMIGVSFGAPYEFRYLGKIQEDPIRPWRPEYVDNSLDQDDLYVQMTFLQALEEKGLAITSLEAGRFFADSRYDLWHANNEARENLQAGIFPPDSGDPRYNPHADDIDFQIESDLFGILCPGMPLTAVRLAERFGRVMNYGDGLYGGLFIAGMYTAAYFNTDRVAVVEAGLKCIPPPSEYARTIQDVLDYYRSKSDDWRGCWAMLEQKWAQDDLCPDGRGQPFNIDAKLNGAYVVMGLLFGNGDFARTLEIATRTGQDSDCNPSTAAGLLGCMIGYNRIPSEDKLGIPLIANRNFAFTPYNYESLILACKRVAREIVTRNGGSSERLGDREYLAVPIEEYRVLVPLEQFTDALYQEVSPSWPDLPQFRQTRLQTRLQDELNRWAPGWTVAHCALVMNPGLHAKYEDQTNVFVTHPLDKDTPCTFSWQGSLTSPNPSLKLLVAGSDVSEDADWLLRVRVDGNVIHEQTIGPLNRQVNWWDVQVDLTAFSGKSVQIVLENASNDGNHEAAYWAKIQLTP